MKIRERMDELQQMLKGDSKASLGESASSHSLGKQKRPPSFPGKTQTGEQQMSVAPMTKKKNKKRSQSQQPTLPNIKSTSLLEDCTNEERNDVRVDSSLDTTEHRNTITSSTASTDFSEHRFRDMAKSLQRRVSKIKLKSSTGRYTMCV